MADDVILETRTPVAFDLIKFFLSSGEYLERIDSTFSLAPSKRSLTEKELFGGKVFSSFSQILDRTVWPGLVPVDYENMVTARLIDPVVIDHVGAGDALQDTQRGLVGLLASLGFQSRESDYAHAADLRSP